MFNHKNVRNLALGVLITCSYAQISGATEKVSEENKGHGVLLTIKDQGGHPLDPSLNVLHEETMKELEHMLNNVKSPIGEPLLPVIETVLKYTNTMDPTLKVLHEKAMQQLLSMKDLKDALGHTRVDVIEVLLKYTPSIH